MKSIRVRPVSSFRGTLSLPGDKSICHRAIIISSLANTKTIIKNFSFSQDCVVTMKAFVELGIKILKQSSLIVYGRGLYGLKAPRKPLYMGESGTCLRLIAGLLAAQRFNSSLIAAPSLCRRPMKRITYPLRLMGAKIKARLRTKKEEYPPFTIHSSNLKAIKHKLPIPSAQVKSAILLAGLYAKGKTVIIEPIKSRDHTERMLKLFKANIKIEKSKLTIERSQLRSPGMIEIPGDISSAAFFIVGACILPNSKLTIKSVSLNPTRIGLLRVLKRMGADIKIKNQKSKIKNFEPIGDIIIKTSKLKGTIVKSIEIPSLIDELPILMVAACFAEGKTILDAVGELRVKETDRIRSMVSNLKKMGANIQIRIKKSTKTTKEQIIIKGVSSLKGANLDSSGDHRSAMSLVIAALCAQDESILYGINSVKKSFPDFLPILSKITVRKK